jgi:hypothetical protein
MITCPWCGSSYTKHQTNCTNCGGPLPLPVDSTAPPPPVADIAEPPAAPRTFRDNFVWRKLGAEGWVIAAGVFALVGAIFGVVGLVLTLAVVTAFVGIPFALLGGAFLVGGGGVLAWRYNEAQKTLTVLRTGEATLGQIVDVYQNTSVEVNGRHPWNITYRFDAGGQTHEGKTTTLRTPGMDHQEGQPVYVLYLSADPWQNTIYPPVM